MQLFSVVCLLKASQFLALERLTKVASASRTRVVLSLHKATTSVRVRRFDCEGFVIDEVLCNPKRLTLTEIVASLMYVH